MPHGKKDGKKPLPGQSLKLQDKPNAPRQPGNSTSWSSVLTTEGARLARLQNMALHLGFTRSPFFPKNISQYATHLQEIQAVKISAEHKRIIDHTEKVNNVDEFGKPFKYGKFLNGKLLEYKRADAKGMKQERVWSYGTTKVDDKELVRTINWPTTVEAKFDGEYRAKRGLKRQLPMPKRKVDEDTAVRLMNMGMKIEMAFELLYAPEEEVGPMLKDALSLYGLDELAWKQIEERLVKAEKEEQELWLLNRHAAGYRPDGGWYLEEEVPLGGHLFDEKILELSGAWDGLLKEMNKD